MNDWDLLSKIKQCLNILSIPSDVDFDRDDIKRSFRVLANIYHPDKRKINDNGKKFKEISTAYEYIINNYNLVKETLLSEKRIIAINQAHNIFSEKEEKRRKEIEKFNKYKECKRIQLRFLILTIISIVALVIFAITTSDENPWFKISLIFTILFIGLHRYFDYDLYLEKRRNKILLLPVTLIIFIILTFAFPFLHNLMMIIISLGIIPGAFLLVKSLF